MTTPIIEFYSVSKTYSTPSGDVEALKDVSLTIDAGEIFSFIGYSGAGKSTLVRLINGLESVTSGHLLVGGNDIASLRESELRKARQGIGMIFQHFNLFTSRTVAGNVAYPLRVAGWNRVDRERRVAELLKYVGLLDRAHAYPDQLSGGQKQRVGIARALAASPAILLADEATSALDPETTRDVLSLLKQVNHDLGITVVVITHELSVVRFLAQRVAVLDAGELVELGSVFDIFAKPRSRTAQRFVATVLHDRPTEDEARSLLAAHTGRLVTARLREGAKIGPTLAHAHDLGVSFDIVHGGLNSLQQRTFGSLTLELDGDPVAVQQVISQLGQVAEVDELKRTL